MASERRLQGAVVAVTGGARGIGLATARAFARAGAKVSVGDLEPAALGDPATVLGPHGLVAELDVTDRRSFERFLRLVEERLGPLAVLVNNAGIMPVAPFLEEPDETAAKVVQIDLLGVMTGMKLALPGMLRRGDGHIINVASAAGKAPVPGGASYCAAKAGVVMLTETVRVEFAGRGVAFTCVMPSYTRTELIAGTRETRFVRTVTPERVAAAIVAAARRPREDVYVPRSVGAIVKLQALFGRRFRDLAGRALGADRAFLEIDQGARAAYEQRLARTIFSPGERDDRVRIGGVDRGSYEDTVREPADAQ